MLSPGDSVRVCHRCGNEFTGRRSNAIYCSQKCCGAAQSLAYNRRNPEATVERTMRWRTANPEWVKGYEKRFHARQRVTVLDHYGGACACCGEATPEFLTVDHVNNDGAQHRREGATNIYRWLVRNDFPPGFQLLCWNCNAAKQFSSGCPHQRAALIERG
jgi:hypothetical protein